MADASDTTRAPDAQQSEPFPVGGLMGQMLERADLGDTPHQVTRALADRLLGDVAAARAILGQVAPEWLTGTQQLGLLHVLDRAHETALDLNEVLLPPPVAAAG